MSVFKSSIPAAALTATVILSGCFDMGQEPASESVKTEPVAASVASSQTWTQVCIDCGSVPAFSATVNPTNFWGWALDYNYTPLPVGGYAIRRITSQGTLMIPGGLVDLDILGNNELWGVNSNGNLYRNNNPSSTTSTWIQVGVPSFARRVGVGGAGKAWLLTNESTTGGYKIYSRLISTSGWTLVPGGLVEIDVDNNGDVWGVNSQGNIYRLPGGNPSATWELKGTNATNIACGGGKVYMMTNQNQNGGYGLKRWTGSSFVDMPGGVVNIQVDVGGRLWSGNSYNHIMYYTP